MEFCISDASLYYKTVQNKLIGICATYVDDTLHAGTEDYSKICAKTEERFKCKKREWDKTQFAGVQIDSLKDHLKCTKKRTLGNLKLYPTNQTLENSDLL